MRDITQRKNAEEAHRETEERYRSIVETSPDAITLTGLDRKIVICNQQAAALHGYDSADEMFGMDALELVAPDDREGRNGRFAECVQDGESQERAVTD